ncbi:MAG: Gfo/Idh/MocA family oxidoreductase [Casimicrobiaceae bacterium]
MRVGLVGAGMVSEFHLRAWGRCRDANVVAIADPDVDRAIARAREFGVAAVYADLPQMLARERLDAVDVASPRETHATMVTAAAARGCAILCQKPFAPTLAEAQRLLEALPTGARVMIHENWRFRPAYRHLARWLAAGKLGTLRSATLTLHSAALVRDADGRYPMLVRQPFIATLDRLLVAETLIHHLDVLRWLLGPLSMESATLERRCVEVLGEDRALLSLLDRSRAAIVVDADLCVPGAPTRAAERLDLVGSASSIRFADGALERLGSDPCRIAFDAAAGYQQSFDDCIAHFVDCVAHAKRFETAPDDNLKTLALVEAAYTLSDRRAGHA